jgi:hypothetical protein
VLGEKGLREEVQRSGGCCAGPAIGLRGCTRSVQESPDVARARAGGGDMLKAHRVHHRWARQVDLF